MPAFLKCQRNRRPLVCALCTFSAGQCPTGTCGPWDPNILERRGVPPCKAPALCCVYMHLKHSSVIKLHQRQTALRSPVFRPRSTCPCPNEPRCNTTRNKESSGADTALEMPAKSIHLHLRTLQGCGPFHGSTPMAKSGHTDKKYRTLVWHSLQRVCSSMCSQSQRAPAASCDVWLSPSAAGDVPQALW